MFGFLKKKLKESVEKISKIVKKEEIEVEKVEKAIKEEKLRETKEIVREAKKGIPREIEEEVVKIKPAEIKEEKKGLIERLKRRIKEKTLEEKDLKEILWDLQIGLIESDVAVEVAEKICNDLRNDLIGKSISRKKVEEVVKSSLKNSILDILNVNSLNVLEEVKGKKPFLILLLGFNGSGKTTSIAKVGNFLKQKDLNVVFAAADTFRAAAIQQLEVHGNNLGIKVIKQDYGSDPAAVVFDAVEHSKAKGMDVILADTAGRSHANVNLVDELKKIVRVNKPDLKILILDALTGNDVVEQVKMFDEAVGIDGLILTKTDVYDKGGAILSAVHTANKPIIFIGTGQDYKDLEEFNAEKIVENLLS